MPELQKEVSVKFTAKSDDAALLEFLKNMQGAQVQLAAAGEKAKGAGKDAEEGSKGFSQLKDTIMDLGQKLLGLVALEKLGSWLLKGASDAAEEERSLRKLADAANRWGVDGAKAAEVAERLATEMLALGVDEGETYKTFKDFLGLTKDLTEAQDAFALSANLAAAQDISFAEAQQVVIGLMQGRKGAMREAYKMGAEGAMDEADALRILTEQTRGAAAADDDAVTAKRKFKAELDNVAEEIGGPLNDAMLMAIQWFHNLILAVEFAGAAVVIFAQTAGRAIKDWVGVLSAAASGDFIRHPLDTLRKVEDEYFRISKEGVKSFIKDTGAAWDQIAADAEAKWGKVGSQVDSGNAPKVHGVAGEGGGKGDMGADAAKIAEKAVLALARAYVELAQAEQQAAMEELEAADSPEKIHAAAKRAVSARIDLLRLQRSEVEAEYQAEITAAQKAGAKTEDIEKAHDVKIRLMEQASQNDIFKIHDSANKRILASDKWLAEQSLQLLKDEQKKKESLYAQEAKAHKKLSDLLVKDTKSARQKELEAVRSELLKVLFSEGLSAKQTERIRKDLAAADIAIEKEKQLTKIQLAQQATATAFGLATAIFGQHKALAIAETVISTYFAAQQAYLSQFNPPDVSSPVRGAVAAAIAIAAGLARVATITQQEPPQTKGFDNPEYDAMVYQGSKKWAVDQTRLMIEGFRAGWQDFNTSGGGSITYDQRQTRTTHGPTVHIHQTNLTKAEADRAYRTIERRLIPAKVQNRRGRLGGNKRYGGRTTWRG